MRKIMFLFVVFMFLFSLKPYAQWIQTNGPITNSVNVSCFGLSSAGMLAGTDMGIFITTDNGINWRNLSNQVAYCFAFRGNELFAGGSPGVWKSTNNGINWVSIPGISWTINCIAVSGNNIFAGTTDQTQGIFCSTNNGLSWNRPWDLIGKEVYSIAIVGNTVFAGTGNDMETGVYKSTNYGISWSLCGLPNASIAAITLLGTDVFASMSNKVFCSTNLGLNWVECGFISNGLVNRIAVSGTDIYAGTQEGVFFSTNKGTSWILTGLIWNTTALEAAGSNVYAGASNALYYSFNNGANWYMSGLPLFNIKALAQLGQVIFAGTDKGIYSSSDNGANWRAHGLTNKQIYSLVVSGNYIFAGTFSSGIFRLSNYNDTNWININSGIRTNDLNSKINALTVSGANLLAGIDKDTWGVHGGVYYSTNNGTLWQLSDLNDYMPGIHSLASSGPNAYAGVYNNSSSNVGLYRSTNYGINWTPASLNTIKNVNAITVSGVNIYAGTQQDGIFLSSNNGVNWIPVNTGLTDYSVSSLRVVGPNVFAGTVTKGIFLSTDNGSMWNDVNYGLNFRYEIKALHSNNDFLYAGTNGLAVWQRTLSELIGIEQISGIVPSAFSLYQNYPNPFNPVTMIGFDVPKTDLVTLKIFDITGREVTVLVNTLLKAGKYSVDWNGKDKTGYPVSSGVYFYRINADGFVNVKKMILVK